MPTFKDRVEDYIGTIDDTSGLDQFLKDACHEVLSQASPDLLAKEAGSRALYTGSAGWSVQDKRVLDVARRFGSQQIACREVRAREAWHYTDDTSIHLATNRSPVFWIQVTATDARLYVKPDPAATAEADVTYVAFPAPDADVATSDSNVPTGAEDAVVLATARRVLQKRRSDYLGEDDLEHAAMQDAEIAHLDALFAKQMERLKQPQ